MSNPFIYGYQGNKLSWSEFDLFVFEKSQIPSAFNVDSMTKGL